MAMKIKDSDLQEAVDLLHKYGTPYRASRHCKMPPATLRDRNKRALQLGFKPQVNSIESELDILRRVNKELKKELKDFQAEKTDANLVKEKIIKLANLKPDIPEWTTKILKKPHLPGVPTLFCSDWHYGETVFPDQIGGVNAFNQSIAKERIQILTEKTIQMLFNYTVNPEYPGLVLAFGGDMFSGDIHQELTETNEEPMMKSWLSLQGEIIRMIDVFLEHFKKIHVVGVVGNHGRTTMKPRMKNRVFTNFDWLLYQQLNKHYEKDKRLSWQIPNGTDIIVKVQNHTYLYTHGDQFFGGTGWGGPTQPISKGQAQKLMRGAEIEQTFDTMCIGHWHTRMWLPKTIVNSSLKGYDEYSSVKNYSFAHPSQNLWLTKDDAITFFMPIYLNRSGKQKLKETEWISIPK